MPQPSTAPQWFESTYTHRRSRTVRLTRAAIDAVGKTGRPVSLSAIVAMSRQIDPSKQGVSASALLRNSEAHELYVSARAWRPPVRGHTPTVVKRNPFTLPVKLDRRPGDVRRRLARLSKPDLIERLLELQNAYAVVRAAWLKASGPKSIPASGKKSK